jgi:hypothetical protein
MLIYLFVVYLTMLSVAQPMWRQKLGLLVNTELKRIWKEAVVTWIDSLSQIFLDGTEESDEKS